MTEKELRTVSNDYNAETNKTQGLQEMYNTGANWNTIMRKFEDGTAKDISKEEKKTGIPCIITGSGPSLDRTIEKLKDWQGLIICHYSQALSLMYYGIEPDYIVALDAICNWEGLQGVDWAGTKTKLCLHPGVWPSLVDNWPNEMLFYRQNIGGAKSFSKHAQRIMYSRRHGTLDDALTAKIRFETLILTEITMFACTPPTQLIIAQILGVGKTFLTGLDFAYVDDKYRFSNFRLNDKGGWEKVVTLVDKPKDQLIETVNGLYTEPLHLFYKKNFLSAWRLSLHQTFTTDHGAITEMPYADIDAVIAKQGKGFKGFTNDQIIKHSERYLSMIGCYVVRYTKGLGFVEAEDYNNLAGYMENQNRNHICTNCGQELTSSKPKVDPKSKCPACKVGKMDYLNYVDVEKNMAHFKKLAEYWGAKK